MFSPSPHIGFPIVEYSGDDEFLLTKPRDTGGLVSVATACEQMVYEIGDPRRYLLPDVIADFSQVRIQQAGGSYLFGTSSLLLDLAASICDFHSRRV